ncbi:hypothetical protein BHE74_00055039 [Ensete ventricosum]|nr:hypothetical protein BHE74_00055039 [Ensete ventricosum]
MDLADLFPQGIGGVGRYGVEVGAGLNRIARATLRPSWRRSRGGCVSFRNLELWWLRLKRGLSCLDLASEVEKSIGCDDERSRVGRRCMGFYSNGYGAPVPEVLTVPVTYHVVAASVVLAMRCAACLLPLGKVDLCPLISVRSVVIRLTLSCLC